MSVLLGLGVVGGIGLGGLTAGFLVLVILLAAVEPAVAVVLSPTLFILGHFDPSQPHLPPTLRRHPRHFAIGEPYGCYDLKL